MNPTHRFEPFGGESINPALQATQLLRGCTITTSKNQGEVTAGNRQHQFPSAGSALSPSWLGY